MGSRSQLRSVCIRAHAIVIIYTKTTQLTVVLQKLIRMNMPVARDGTVHFSTTLLALVRESLDIKMGPGMPFVRSLD